MQRVLALKPSKGTLEEAYTSGVLRGVVEMSSVDGDFSRSTDGVGTHGIAAEDLGLGRWEIGDLAVVGIVPSVPIKRHSGDLVLDSCGQLFDRVV